MNSPLKTTAPSSAAPSASKATIRIRLLAALDQMEADGLGEIEPPIDSFADPEPEGPGAAPDTL